MTKTPAAPQIKAGDLVVIHGFVATVVTVNDREILYNFQGEIIRYSLNNQINPQPKTTWILE
jgi:hypothetical protein